jgi:hypothetical protein
MNPLALHTVTPLELFLTLYVGLGARWLVGMLAYEHLVNGPDAIIPGLNRNEERVGDGSWAVKVPEWLRAAAGYALLAGLTVLLWPLFTLAMAYAWVSKRLPRKAPAAREEKRFKVERSRLLKPMMVEEIELQEMVSDPLGGAPWAPFGHLNEEWTAFKLQLHPTDQLYSFAAEWENDWGQVSLIEGYVIKRGARLQPWFVVGERGVERAAGLETR